MSRAGSGHRPTHIPLPTSPFVRGSPTGSPVNTPGGLPLISPTSPRSSFLPSFMRPRSRAATMTGTNRGGTSPTAEAANPFAPVGNRVGGAREPSVRPSGPITGSAVTRSVSTPSHGVLANGASSTRETPQRLHPPIDPIAEAPKTHRIRLVPHLETSRSLAFDPVIREVLPIVVPAGVNPGVAAASVSAVGPAVNGRPPALLLKIGRFTDRASANLPVPTTAVNNSVNGSAMTAAGSGTAGGVNGGIPGLATLTIAGGGGEICSAKVAFKSKVVSRAHAEIWCEPGGKFYIRDTASSSGTFLNHIRLSSPNTESRPTVLSDGDVLQLGVDYQGGHEDMYRCVKMRVELGREWQRAANEFNTNAFKQLKALGGSGAVTPDNKGKTVERATSSKKGKASVTDCCICLFSVTVCQSLFIAPCSHVFHYKCIRPLLMQHHPGFSCPLCRTFANLEEDVETEDAWEVASRRSSVLPRRSSNHSIRRPATPPTMPSHPGTEAPTGQPSSGIAFGVGARSVDELLAGVGSASGSGSGRTSEDGMGLPPLARQTTFVAERTSAEGDTTMPLAVYEEEEIDHPPRPLSTPGLFRDPDLAASLMMIHDPTALDAHLNGTHYPLPARPGRINPSNADGITMVNTLDAQTPINETFLSTLAPGMIQRLDLARPIGEGENGSVNSNSGSSRGTSEDRRREVDMMFS